LVANTTYYWRVDATWGGTTYTGDLWKFTTAKPKATLVSPAPNGTGGVSPSALLTWTADPSASSMNVYFGPPGSMTEVLHATAATSYDPVLDWQTTYNWRVDTTVGGVTWEGDLWSFTTIIPVCNGGTPQPGDLDGNCVVDMRDFALLAANWLVCGWNPPESYCP
jgi:hypothetical protein